MGSEISEHCIRYMVMTIWSNDTLEEKKLNLWYHVLFWNDHSLDKNETSHLLLLIMCSSIHLICELCLSLTSEILLKWAYQNNNTFACYFRILPKPK